MQPIPGCGFWGALLSSGSNVEALRGYLSWRDKVAADRNPPFHRVCDRTHPKVLQPPYRNRHISLTANQFTLIIRGRDVSRPYLYVDITLIAN